MGTTAEDRIVARRAEAIQLRVSGKTIREIAAALKVSVGTAYGDVEAVMAETVARSHKHADTERAIELARLDKATQLCMQAIDEGELAAVDKLVKLQDRRAKLLGLDAPERRELSGPDGGALKLDARHELIQRLASLADCESSGDASSGGSGEPEPSGS